MFRYQGGKELKEGYLGCLAGKFCCLGREVNYFENAIDGVCAWPERPPRRRHCRITFTEYTTPQTPSPPPHASLPTTLPPPPTTDLRRPSLLLRTPAHSPHTRANMPSATGQSWEKYQKNFADDEVEEKKITPLTDE
jgi:hypothetical protein